MDIWQIVSLAMGILAVVLGVCWVQIKVLLKQASEALTAVLEALEDDEVSRDEAKRIAEEWTDVVIAARRLIVRK